MEKTSEREKIDGCYCTFVKLWSKHVAAAPQHLSIEQVGPGEIAH